MKIIRIIAVEIRKYFKNTDVSPKKIYPKFVLSLNYQKIYINIYV
jgi:hypothetical protein